jgi:hypothetical protein
MGDYYDRLEARLAELTERGAHRRRGLVGWVPSLRIRTDLVAVAVSVVVVAAVGVALLGLRARHDRSQHPSAVGGVVKGLPVLRNMYPAPLPAPSGSLLCDSTLSAPGRRGLVSGGVRVYAKPPTSSEMFLTAVGLRPIAARDVYAVWLLPAIQLGGAGGPYQLQRSEPPRLLGLIKPSPGSGGHVTLGRALDPTFNGLYKLVIAVQRGGSTRAPGAIALQGWVST